MASHSKETRDAPRRPSMPAAAAAAIAAVCFGAHVYSCSTPANLLRLFGEPSCSDAGPWPCEEEGCPLPSLGCADLAELGVCASAFSDIWTTPPADAAGRTVESLCPRTCGKCPSPAGGGARPAAMERLLEEVLDEEEALDPPLEHALAAARDWVRPAGATRARRVPPPPHVLTALSEAAWRRSHLALELLRELEARGGGGAELVSALATACARRGLLTEAARYFEAAAKIAPDSVMRLVKHRLHNLELISGRSPAPIHEALPEAPPGHGGWGGSGDQREATSGGSRGGDGVLDPGAPYGALSRLGLRAWVQAAVGVGDVSEGERGSAIQCDVDVRAELTPSEFATRYVLEGRPVLLPLDAVARLGLDGAPPGALSPSAASDAASGGAPAPWDREELLRRAGDICEVSLVPTSGVAQQQYGGAPAASARTLSAAVAAIEAAATADAAAAAGSGADSDPLYAVATRPFASQPVRTPQEAERRECWAELDRAMALQRLGDLPEVFLPGASHKRILFVAANGTGTYWHDHSNAFNLVPHGSKHWLLLPPSGSYDAHDAKSRGSPAEWFRRRHSNSR